MIWNKSRIVFLLGLLCTAMTCEDNDPEITSIPSTLSGIELIHLDNTKEYPVLSTTGRIKKEAYILCIRLVIDSEPYDETHPFGIPTLTDPIQKTDIYASSIFDTDKSSEIHVSDRFKDYPLMQEDHLYDLTSSGKLLSECKQSTLYKAILLPLPADTYIFRVLFTLESGHTVEGNSTPVEFY